MPRYTNKQFEKAIEQSGGVISNVARIVGCDWHTAKNRIDGSKRLTRLFENAKEDIDDLAESTIIQSIMAGNVRDSKWWLARRRRAVFSERHEVTGAEGSDLIPRVTKIEIVVPEKGDN